MIFNFLVKYSPLDTNRNREKKCPYCEKIFKHQQNFREHVLSKHENKKNFHCDKCEKSFGTINTLKTHKLNVHTRVPCEQCGKEIHSSFGLKRHKALVHGIKPEDVHQCNLCPLFFNSRMSLDKHITSKHF